MKEKGVGKRKRKEKYKKGKDINDPKLSLGRKGKWVPILSKATEYVLYILAKATEYAHAARRVLFRCVMPQKAGQVP